MKQWLEKALPLSIDERSDLLARNGDLAQAHESCAQSGDTNAECVVDHHFICYLNHAGKLYEFGQILVSYIPYKVHSFISFYQFKLVQFTQLFLSEKLEVITSKVYVSKYC